ncbi:MAG: MCE family protein, partial [Alistipes sp.]|nr:MCE family protein [Alistipes sp.]
MKKEVKIGIYALLIFLGSWAGIRFLSGADIFGRNNVFYAYYDDASGLQNASSVVIRGVKVGQVSSVAISPEDPTKVQVTLAVSKDYTIPVDSKAKIFSAGLMGGQAVEIVLGKDSALLEPGATITSAVEVGMFDALSSEFGDIKEKLVVMMDNINTTLTTLNTLVDSNNANISSAISNLNGILADLEKSQIVSNLDSFTGTLKNNGEKIDSIVSSVNNLATTLDEQQMGQKLAAAVDNLSTLLAKFNSAEGTVG